MWREIPGFIRYVINSETSEVKRISTDIVLKQFNLYGTPHVCVRSDSRKRLTRSVKGLYKLAFPVEIISLPKIITEAGLPPSEVNKTTLQVLVQEKFTYNPLSGDFLGKGIRNPEGWVNNGYRFHYLNGVCQRTHNLIFVYMLGEFPKGFVDHIDHNTLNNKWENLRVVDKSTNAKNLSKYVTNTSGVTGVNWHSKQKKWNARIMVDKKSIHLGCFLTMEEAVEARKLAEVKYNFHMNHGK